MRRRWLSVVLALAVAAPAGAAVVVEPVPGLGLGGEDHAPRGAVGLLVPDAGPRTSEARARASLERGRVRNSLHGELPEAPPLVELTASRSAGLEDIVVGIPEGGDQPNDRRYLLVVRMEGYGGLLTSRSTRIPGLVSVVDVAPTALGRDGALGWTAHPDPMGYLRALDARIRDNGVARVPAAALALAVILALAFVVPAAAVLAFATAALGNLLLGLAGVSEPWLTIPAIGCAAAAAAPLWLALRSRLAAALVLAGTLAAYLAAMAIDATWVALSPLGPTQNARFFGLSNVLATLLLVPALAGAALLRRRWGWPAYVLVAAVALAAVGSSRLGADGGGAVVLAAGLAVLAVALAPGARAALVAAVGAAAAVALVALDAAVGPSTHVGRAVRGGPGEVLGDVGDRLVLSWERATASPVHALAIAAALAVVAALLVRGARGPLPLALAAALAVSLLVNDSPLEVAVGGAAAMLALARFAVCETDARGYNPPG